MLFTIVFIVLLLIKLLANPHLSWWWVFSPLIVWGTGIIVFFGWFFSGLLFRPWRRKPKET